MKTVLFTTLFITAWSFFGWSVWRLTRYLLRGRHERSQRAESNLIESFENAASGLLGQVGTLVIVVDEDEHLALGVGGFRARVIPEGESGWRDLSGANEIVQFYDPTDVFGDLAEALVEAYPAVEDENDGAEGPDNAEDDNDDGGDGSDGK